ncbi:MAG: hypothetical protein J2P21_08350, partial [Chloracidobacterium sp.]|nr:hypothetical protein [Chloracidobacterium sp.]
MPIPLSNKTQSIQGVHMKFRICLVAFCLLVFYCSAYGQTQTPPAEWEYKQLEYPHPPNINDEAFNYYAKNGWEIVAVDGGKVILKRSRSHPLFGTKTPEPPP